MTNIKKQFVSIFNVLEANKEKMSKTLYQSLVDECVSKTLAKTFRTNEDGNLEVFCWYHKEWEDTTLVEYGAKKGTKTGLNTFCKQGVSHWTRQQRDFKKAKESLIDQLMNGDIQQDELAELMSELEQESKVIHPLEAK